MSEVVRTGEAPAYCLHGNSAVLVRVEVEHPMGHTYVGGLSDFTDGNQSGEAVTLRRGYRFRSWVPQCVACLKAERQQAVTV